MSLEVRLAQLKGDLLHQNGPSISTNQNYPFALFHYAPTEEFQMRAKLGELVEQLRSLGWSIRNVDLFACLIEFLSVQEGGTLIPELIQEEKLQYRTRASDFHKPLQYLHNTLDGYFKNANEYSSRVIAQIQEVAKDCDAKKSVVFLSRVGALYPFYRTSSLLRFLDQGVRIPTIILYPGVRTEQHFLSFMGEMDADRDYRPRIY